jgi:peptide/nickel transport system ATP-binding protein
VSGIKTKATQDYTTQMKDEDNILEVEDLKTYFYTDAGILKAVDGISFNVRKGTTLGIVGESGSGKSVTSLSIMRLVQGPTGKIVDGQIRLKLADGAIDIISAPDEVVRSIRGNEIAMIFQEPFTAMNPVFSVGFQIDEVIKLHQPELNDLEVKEKTIEILTSTGIARAEGIYKQYPHELSGGMRQRVMIAMALACNPKLIIADEPTTALDVTIQAQILDLLLELKEKINASIILITHDLGVIAQVADDVIVMYAGVVVESGTIREIFKDTRHPYTIGLIKSRPGNTSKDEELYSIPGQVPNPIDMEPLCYFRDRCFRRSVKCELEYPKHFKISETHQALCWYYDEVHNESN